MGILEELWDGDAFPQYTKKGSEYRFALRKFDKEKNEMLSQLPLEQQNIFHDIFEKQVTPNALAERDAFVCGFRLAVKLLSESLFCL